MSYMFWSKRDVLLARISLGINVDPIRVEVSLDISQGKDVVGVLGIEHH